MKQKNIRDKRETEEEKGEVRGLKRETDTACTHTHTVHTHTHELVWFLDFFFSGIKIKTD